MAGSLSDLTLDKLLRRSVLRRPDDIALMDAPNRSAVADGASRHLTFAQVDRAVSILARRLQSMELPSGAIVGFQLPNTTDSVVTLLAIARAGLIAMPMPLLWRQAEAATAMARVGANVLIVNGRVGDFDHLELAVNVAAEVFTVRYVCAFGNSAADGIVALDDIFTSEPEPQQPAEDLSEAGNSSMANQAVITWDVTSDGLIGVARSHAELISGSLAIVLESRMPEDTTVLSTLMMGSFGGLTTTLVPWLIVGGTLALHHPFDETAFADQIKTSRCRTLVLPGPLVTQFASAEYFKSCEHLRNIVSVWRAPERLGSAPVWNATGIAMIDVQVFGETGLIAGRRAEDGVPLAIPIGSIVSPRGSDGGLPVIRTRVSADGRLAVRGPMVPQAAFPPGIERTGVPHFKVAADGFTDTGYRCRPCDDSSRLTITAPPPGIVSIGGYRLSARELDDAIAALGRPVTLTTLPDAFAGQRLAGSAPESHAIARLLAERGANPLLAEAFGSNTPCRMAAE